MIRDLLLKGKYNNTHCGNKTASKIYIFTQFKKKSKGGSKKSPRVPCEYATGKVSL